MLTPLFPLLYVTGDRVFMFLHRGLSAENYDPSQRIVRSNPGTNLIFSFKKAFEYNLSICRANVNEILKLQGNCFVCINGAGEKYFGH